MRGIGDPESTSTAYFVLVGVVVVVVVVLLVQAWFYSYERSLVDRRLVETPSEHASRVQAEQQELLESYGWVDEAKTQMRIPVDRAMDIVVEEAGSE